MVGIAVTFSARREPLEPVCVVGVGEIGRRLAQRVLANGDEALRALRGMATSEALVILGASESLPWVDGVQYLGQDAGAPRLLLPTQLRPSVPVDAFERALLRHAAKVAPPLAVLLDPPRVISVAEARPLDRDRVRAWLEVRA
ncbi:hypothetical protein [Pendulispora albinea]|uniref:MoxR-vWA-beta-propeller ternary system domain-containing protein n=1 Tax=Pendulispora albinea TaxID=2741071 RepID=A0ABZ2LXA8_9BACT